MKPVLLIVIDALAWEIVQPELESDRFPHFQELLQYGSARPCTSIFPSITPAATATIITGHYPERHGIVGSHWWDSQKDLVNYMGSDFWVVARRGWGDFLQDFLVRSNQECLRSETLFEIAEQQQLTTASVNFLWYKGTTAHQLDAPWLLKLIPGLDLQQVILGPQLLYLGDFVSTPLPGTDTIPESRGGMSRRYGFHDESTIDRLLELIPLDNAPEVVVAYFPNNDFDSHLLGPHQAADTVERVDSHLGRLADRCGGLAKLLERYAVMIVGDHAQTPLFENLEDRTIDLSQVLAEFELVDAGNNWTPGKELFVCPNLRAAQIYFRDGKFAEQISRVTELLLSVPAVDQVLWTQAAASSLRGDYHVRTRDRGNLVFRVDKQHPMARDVYGNGWSWQGDLRSVDAAVDPEGTLRYGDYPNALERIVGGFSERSAPLWVTARDGVEFCMPGTEIQEGGSHATLHQRDSQSALLVGGLPPEVTVPDQPRIVDIAPLCLQILGIPAERLPGRGHFSA